ncbi:MAG TPA: hypothetical protein VM597_28005 [Gemmataceae bacterium]|jgi:hypothetical protein|nr:hypothetical protein [Gemmataceae bacterium]
MSRPRFDLGLFVVCTLPVFLFFAAVFAAEVWRRGWRDWLGAWVAGSAVGSLGIGFGIYDWLRRAGYQWTRARPEDAEDYDERE